MGTIRADLTGNQLSLIDERKENHGSQPDILNSKQKLKVDNYFSATPQTATLDINSHISKGTPVGPDHATIGETPSQLVTRSINPDSARLYETIGKPGTPITPPKAGENDEDSELHDVLQSIPDLPEDVG